MSSDAYKAWRTERHEHVQAVARAVPVMRTWLSQYNTYYEDEAVRLARERRRAQDQCARDRKTRCLHDRKQSQL